MEQSQAHEWTVSLLDSKIVVTTGTRLRTIGDFQFEFVETGLSSLSVVAFAELDGTTILCDHSLNPGQGQLQQTTVQY